MSKVLLIADPHAGVKSDSDLFLNIFKDFFENFIPEQITKHQISTIFLLGDLLDNRNSVNIKTLNTVYQTFKNLLSKHPEINIYIFLGNHDIYYRNKKDVNSLNIFNEFKNITIVNQITELDLFNRKIIMCPWLTNTDEIEEVFKRRADVCMGHFEINGFEMVPGIKEHDGLSPNRFTDNFKLTFSGHFHLRNEQGPIIYVGNPYQTKWSDFGNTKGLYLLDLNNLKYDFLEFDRAPKFKKLFLSQIKKKIVNLKEDVPNNFISLVIDEDIKAQDLDKLNYLISSLNPLSFGIMDAEKSYGEIIMEEFSSNPIEFLLEYINSRKFEDSIDKNILSKKFSSLYNKTNIM